MARAENSGGGSATTASTVPRRPPRCTSSEREYADCDSPSSAPDGLNESDGDNGPSPSASESSSLSATDGARLPDSWAARSNAGCNPFRPASRGMARASGTTFRKWARTSAMFVTLSPSETFNTSLPLLFGGSRPRTDMSASTAVMNVFTRVCGKSTLLEGQHSELATLRMSVTK